MRHQALLPCLLLAAAAHAAEPVRLQAPPPRWEGVHLGLAAGHLSGTEQGYETPQAPGRVYAQRLEPDGAAVGVVAGYDLSFARRYIAGLEMDAEYRDLSREGVQSLNGTPTSVANNGYADPVRFEAEWAIGVRPRLGVLFNQWRTLGYVTGGLAVAELRRRFGCVGNCGFGPGDPTRVTHQEWELGWTAGAGLEHVFGSLAARVEYRYADYGDAVVGLSALYGPTTREQESFAESGVRLALLWRF